MDLLVTSTVACIARFYDTVLMLPWIYCIHAYVLSYASANCMLAAYMLLHRGICTFGASFTRQCFDNYTYRYIVTIQNLTKVNFGFSIGIGILKAENEAV